MPRPSRLSRRTVLSAASAAGLAAGLAAGPAPVGRPLGEEPPRENVSVLTATVPDPVPPGADTYYEALVRAWERRNGARILTESAAVQTIGAKLQLNFQAGRHVYDVVYSAGWLPTIAPNLYRLEELTPRTIRDDLEPSSFNAVRWGGSEYGVPYSANLVILYVNRALLAAAGIAVPPATWDELLAAARELTRDGVSGLALPFGQLQGIGSLTSHWIILLQQAGGRLLDNRGQPAFVDGAGVDALQLLVDLAPTLDPFALGDRHVNDVIVSFMQGRAAMMMTWSSAYPLLTDPRISAVAGEVGMSTLPAGPAGSASIDAADAWAIAGRTWVVEKAMSLVELYLDPRAQRQLCLTTGALPVRLTVLEDSAVVEAAPQAAVVREQMRSPYDNFLTPNYAVVTSVIGAEIAAAMRGSKTPGAALRDAADALRELARTTLLS